MAAITADNVNIVQAKPIGPHGMVVDIPTAATTAIYKNSFVMLNSAGFLTSQVAWTQGTTGSGGTFVGVALEAVASQTSAGDKTCAVMVHGYFQYGLTAGAQLDVGKPVYVLDNATLTKLQTAADATAAAYEFVGAVVGIESTGNVIVDMPGPAVRSGWAGGVKNVVRVLDFAASGDDEVVLLPANENHNGVLLYSCNSVVSEAVVSTSASAVVTIVHTEGTDTTLGVVLTFINAAPVADVIIGTPPGFILGPTSASNDNMIAVPADVAVIAKVTTLASGGTITGQARIFASFVAL